MSYQGALEAAGAVILEFKEFGSYQGDWYALVEYQGERGWVQGCYGSCTECDAFEGEFGDWYDKKDDADYHERLKSFGEGYLPPMRDVAGLLAEMDERGEWDWESEEAAVWIREINDKYGI
mgnify:CR=1 FL=1